MKWFIQEVPSSTTISRKDLELMILDYFSSSFKPTTITYALQALLQVFKYSPIGTEFEILMPEDSKGNNYKRVPYNDVSPEAVAYSVYKFASSKGADMIRVSDFYKPEERIGIFHEFGVTKNELIKKLRSLQSDSDRVLTAELNMGLDHITINPEMTPLMVLEKMTK